MADKFKSVATKFKNLDTLVLKNVLWVLSKIAVLKPNQVSTPIPFTKNAHLNIAD